MAGMQVNPANGIIYATDVAGDVPDTATKPHWMGTHSAPWYLYQVLPVAQEGPCRLWPPQHAGACRPSGTASTLWTARRRRTSSWWTTTATTSPGWATCTAPTSTMTTSRVRVQALHCPAAPWRPADAAECADGPGDHLLHAYKLLHSSMRFELRGGADFVFYDSHPGARAVCL